MKKKIIGGITILAIATIAAFNMNINSENNYLPLLSIDNIEALASETINTGDPCYNDTKFDSSRPKAVVCGTPCKYEGCSFKSTTTSKCY